MSSMVAASMVADIEASIGLFAELEAELAEATARKDQRAIKQASEALEARRAWLRAVEG